MSQSNGVQGGNFTTKSLKNVKLTEKLLKQKFTTMLSSTVRTLKSTGETTKFPFDLSGERYIQIIVFDTSEGDPNAFLAKTSGEIVTALGSSFSNLESVHKAKEGNPADILSDSGNTLSKDSKTTSLISSFKDDFLKKASADWDSYMTNWNVGNPGIKKDNVKDNLFLALPNELSEDLSHTYTEQESLFDQLRGLVPGVKEVTNIPINLVTGTSNIIAKASGRQALSYNKNLLAKFDSSAFRSITLSWTLIANSQEEAIAIQTIITKLKAYSSPQAVANKLLLRAPFFCELKFGNPILNQALKFEEVVITNIAVNYSVSGYMETFHDDMPKTISLSVTFQDREPKTMQAWASDNELAKGYG